MASAKLPSFQFYPGDWLRDPVSSCSLAAQGLWLRIMLATHDSERYGYLQQDGAPIPVDRLCRMVGCSQDELTALLKELDAAGVPSRTSRGIIFSRRMVRDFSKKADDRARQLKHRKGERQPIANKTKGPCHALVTPDVTALSQPSSSSSSTSENKPPTPFRPELTPDIAECAERIWQRHPAIRRGTLDEAVRDLLEVLDNAVYPSKLAAGIDRRHKGWCETKGWQEEDGQYATGLTKWLTKGGCMREPPQSSSESKIPAVTPEMLKRITGK